MLWSGGFVWTVDHIPRHSPAQPLHKSTFPPMLSLGFCWHDTMLHPATLCPCTRIDFASELAAKEKYGCYQLQLDDEDQVVWTHTGARSSYCPVSRNLVFTFQLVRKSKIRSLETWVLTRAETKKPLMRVAFVLASKFQGRARKLRSSA